MKHTLLLTSLLLTVSSLSYSQTQLTDTHPRAAIFILDYQAGQPVQANSDQAILFKDAFIDLVKNSHTAMAIRLKTEVQGPLLYTITQMDPQTNVNGYQLMLQSGPSNQQTRTVYTFLFNVDDQKLYFFDQNTQNWRPEIIRANNTDNLDRCISYSRFNDQSNYKTAADTTAQPVDNAAADINAPVDTNITANTPPPPMPDYDQPECPSDGYLWQPGFWAYSPYRNDYYWVPGVWVAPPGAGYLWTPPYWGYEGGAYRYHAGYWGNQVGFYGGINYGYGYSGRGYAGGEWRGNSFAYNTAVVHVNTNVVHHTYVNNNVVNNTGANNHTSYNGPGGVGAKPTSIEISAAHGPHLKPTPEQNSNQLQARGNVKQFAKANPGGKPVNLAAPKVPVYRPDNNPAVRPANKPNPPGFKPANTPNQAVKPVNTPNQAVKPANTPNQAVKPANTPNQAVKPVNTPNQAVKPVNVRRPVRPPSQWAKPANTSKPMIYKPAPKNIQRSPAQPGQKSH